MVLAEIDNEDEVEVENEPTDKGSEDVPLLKEDMCDG